MTAPSQPNKLQAFLPYLLAIGSFMGGFYVNYLSYTNKVDVLITAVNELTITVKDQGTNYTGLDKRVSKIEFYLFEYKPSKQTEQTEKP